MTKAPEFAFNIFDPATRADPYAQYAAMREAGPVVANPFLAGQHMVAGYEHAAAVLGAPEIYSSGRLQGPRADGVLRAPTMLNTDPPDHDRLRGVLARAFTPRAVNALEDRMAAVARDLVSPLADGGRFDVVKGLAERLPVLVIAELLGVGTGDLEQFVECSHGLLGVLDPFGPPDRIEHAHNSSAWLHEYFAVEARRRRRTPTGDDLIGRLVAANEDGVLSEDEMLSSCVLLLLGGNETTTKLITNAVLALARHPDERARIITDDALLAPAVEETLRYDTPVQGAARIVTQDVTLGDAELPAGSLLVVLLGAANRDPARFEQPDRFDVARHPNPHLSFGRGVHHCLGAQLARLEARAAVGEVLRAAPDYVLADPDASLDYGGATFFFHAPSRLEVMRA